MLIQFHKQKSKSFLCQSNEKYFLYITFTCSFQYYIMINYMSTYSLNLNI